MNDRGLLTAQAYGPMAVQQVLEAGAGAPIDMLEFRRVFKSVCQGRADTRVITHVVSWNGAYREALFATLAKPGHHWPRLLVEIAADPSQPPRPMGAEAWPAVWLIIRQPQELGNSAYREAVKGFAPSSDVDFGAKELVKMGRAIQEHFPASKRTRLLPIDEMAMRPEGME